MADKRLGLLKKANKLFRQGKTEAAIKEYQKILAIKSDDLEVRRIVGDLQLRQNNIEEAVVQFEWIADHYLKEGFFAKAIAMFKRITRVDPNSESALFKLADLYTRQGLIMEAKQIYLDVAEECKRQNNQKKALGMYKKILEFDRSNIKMRILLADNYLKEGMAEDALTEYITAIDTLASKKDYRRLEELLLKVLSKLPNVTLVEKLVSCYIDQGQDDKAVEVLKSMTVKFPNDIMLHKSLGELYLKKDMMNEAERIFVKIAQLDPEETEVIMRLGKVYLQREEYDRTYELFLPIVDKNISVQKYEEAASLLRFIIASNNLYLPALIKLASIFKASGKKNNLIALYESLIPIYEKEGMIDDLKRVLGELVQISENPIIYEEQLDRLSGREQQEQEQEEDEDRETEFINFNLRVVDDSLKVSDYEKAVETLIKAKSTYPENLNVRSKLFDVYRIIDQVPTALEEGKDLLSMYKERGMKDEYSELFDKLSQLNPEDDQLLEISGDEKTSIEIDIQKDELVEEMNSFGDSGSRARIAEVEVQAQGGDEDLLVLSEDHSVAAPQSVPSKQEEMSKSLSTYLSELDFYINDNYIADAEKLVEGLQKRYPGNKELQARINKLNLAKGPQIQQGFSPAEEETEAPIQLTNTGSELKGHTEPIVETSGGDFVIETAGGQEFSMDDFGGNSSPMEIELDSPSSQTGPGLSLGEDSARIIPDDVSSHSLAPDMGDTSVGSMPEMPEINDIQAPSPVDIHEDSSPVQMAPLDVEMEDPQMASFNEEPFAEIPAPEQDIVVDVPMESVQEAPLTSPPPEQDIPFDIPMVEMIDEPPAPKKEVSTKEFEAVKEESSEPDVVFQELESDPFEVGDQDADTGFGLEIERSISEESQDKQFLEDSKVGISREEMGLDDVDKIKINESSHDSGMELEIEFEEQEDNNSALPAFEVDKDLLVQSPSHAPNQAPPEEDPRAMSGIEELDLSDIMMEDEPEPRAATDSDIESPFREITGTDIAFDSDEEILAEDALFLEETYYEIEKNVDAEMESIIFWLKEVEKQRTSTIEKNMMEIFDEFKKGVDEKIGQEDYDTRYNLGIAYKEMGLLEEAIHEFLISAKHPLKFFDSAGLLGICFRDKGMFSEAATWFEKAVKVPDRKPEEYLAVKFELVMTYKLQDEIISAKKVAEDILKTDPDYRNIRELYQELSSIQGV